MALLSSLILKWVKDVRFAAVFDVLKLKNPISYGLFHDPVETCVTLCLKNYEITSVDSDSIFVVCSNNKKKKTTDDTTIFFCIKNTGFPKPN